MTYNFRIDRTNINELMTRIRNKNLLCQGWGGGEAIELRVDDSDFRKKCQRFYKLASPRIPPNLTNIMEFEASDILIVPICREMAKYRFFS